MSTIFKPPTTIKMTGESSVFLAGTIDQGDSDDWQADVEKTLEDKEVLIFNPRRDDWDADLEQKFTNKTFRAQVEWELDALEYADVIFMNFLADSKSPITLLELGLWAPKNKLILVCPDGFYRKGNVDVIAHRYKIPLFEDLDKGIDAMVKKLNL